MQSSCCLRAGIHWMISHLKSCETSSKTIVSVCSFSLNVNGHAHDRVDSLGINSDTAWHRLIWNSLYITFCVVIICNFKVFPLLVRSSISVRCSRVRAIYFKPSLQPRAATPSENLGEPIFTSIDSGALLARATYTEPERTIDSQTAYHDNLHWCMTWREVQFRTSCLTSRWAAKDIGCDFTWALCLSHPWEHSWDLSPKVGLEQ